MRILHILDHSLPLHSGYTFRTCAILEQQKAMGWEVFSITGPKQGATAALKERFDGFEFYRTSPIAGLAARLPVFKQLAVIRSLTDALDKVAGDLRPDILHAHSPALNGLAALQVGRKRGLPVVYEVRAFWEDAAVDHGTHRPWGVRYRATRLMEAHVLKRADAITTICEGLRQDILNRGTAPSKVTVIPNAVDVEKFSPIDTANDALKTKYGLQGRHVLGFIGSFYSYEGLSLLLQAMPELLSKMANVKLLLVGGGPQESALRRQADELNLNNDVIFTGRVPHDDVPKYYGLIDLLVYPRLSMRLTDLVTPLKPLEAMAYGRPVLASDVGGHRELIQDGVTGFLFKAGDAHALAEVATALLSSRERMQATKTAARSFVETERSWPRSVDRYRDVYRGLLRGA